MVITRALNNQVANPSFWTGLPLPTGPCDTGLHVHAFGRELRPDESRHPAQVQQNPALGFLQQGNATIVIDHATISLGPGDAVYLPAGAVVAQQPAANGLWDWFWVSLDGPLVQHWATAFGWNAETMPLHLGSDPVVSAFFEEMFDEDPHYTVGIALINTIAYQLLLYLGKRGATTGVGQVPANKSTTEDIITFLGRHLHEPLTLPDIADHFCLSCSQIHKRIMRDIGMSPKQYLTYLRVNRAKSLLLSNPNAADVARLVGFTDPNYFYRVFKQLTGLTPTEYRQQEIGIVVAMSPRNAVCASGSDRRRLAGA